VLAELQLSVVGIHVAERRECSARGGKPGVLGSG
jgi:hypothetical protein